MRNRLRTWWSATFLVTAVLGLPRSAAAADPEWTIEILDSDPEWHLANAMGVNDAGVVCGMYNDTTWWDNHALVWRGGTYEKIEETIGVPGGRLYTAANAINNAGLAVGGASDWPVIDVGSQRAVCWDLVAGTHHDLHPYELLVYEESYCYKLSETGYKAGGVFTYDPATGDYDSRAYVWDPGTGSAGRLLPFPTGSTMRVSDTMAVNDAGVAVGSMQASIYDTETHATIWFPDGRIVDLHDAIRALDPNVVWTRPFAVDGTNRVVGHSWNEAFDRGIPWVWTEIDGVRMLETGANTAFYVSDAIQGWGDLIVGTASEVAYVDQRIAIWLDGDLRTLPAIPGRGNVVANDVNTKGTIVGWVMDEGNELWWQGSRPFIARPTPDPARLLSRLDVLVRDAGLAAGTTTSLRAKLDAAAKAKTPKTRSQQIEAFENEVRAQRGKKVPAALADSLLADAEEILGLL